MANDNITKFHEKHGPDYIAHNGWLLWPDGARRENSSYGVMYEPTDPHEIAKAKLLYAKLKSQQAVREFDQMKQFLYSLARAASRDGGHSPNDAALAELKQLQRTVKTACKKLEKAEAEVDRTIPADIKEREAQREKRREASRAVLSKVADITI